MQENNRITSCSSNDVFEVLREIADLWVLAVDKLNEVMKESALVVCGLGVAQLLQCFEFEAVSLTSRSASVEVVTHCEYKFEQLLEFVALVYFTDSMDNRIHIL